ncbi:tetratricopeptide repeat protein [Archangium violaceum]|uniref:tetratricopeptide repeat protein n=1 Tax=Archangium violaceum TaxID=83451 RepID=UPI00193B7982|nr:tetratricopeptide repeat protein [Archangium violaceum]QRK11435.1 tetratricopeptide repeat protein [Archangium violaceum]
MRALYPLAPELEVHTEAQQLAEVKPGSTLVLVPRAEDADWLNLNRPLFASHALRVVLFCTREVSVALSRQAVDFLDWISLRLECPAGPAPYAVAGLRLALAARVPGITWTGGDLEASFAAARPRRVLRRVSAARPYEELVTEAKAGKREEWLAWTEVDGDFRLRRVRWALAEAGRRTRTLLIEPAVPSPGWWEVHGQVTEPGEARERLKQTGAAFPGRLAALVNLEPEAIQLLGGLMEQGLGERTLEEEILKEADPGATVGRLAIAHGLVTEKELIRGRAPPPAMRAFAAERERMRSLRDEELDTLEKQLSQEAQVEREDAEWWSAWAKALPFEGQLSILETRGEFVEALLRHTRRTGMRWGQSVSAAISAGALDVADVWSRHAVDADPSNWALLVRVLVEQGRPAEAESLLRGQLTTSKLIPDSTRAWILHELGYVLHQQGHYTEAEKFLRQSIALEEQSLATREAGYRTSLEILAMVLERQGRYAEAEETLRKSLTLEEQMLGAQHPRYGASLHNLATLLGKEGRYAEAEELLRRSLAIGEQSLGTRHPDYSASLHELALVIEQQGRYTEAEELLRRSLVLNEQVLGKQHPHYGASLHALAIVLERQSRYAEAEELLRQSIDITKQSLGPLHPSHGASLHELAGVLERQGQYIEAEALLRQSLAIIEKSLGPQHPDHAVARHELAAVLERQGRYAEAEHLLRQSVAIIEQTLGPQHPDYGASLHTLALSLQHQDRNSEAEILLRQSITIKEQTLGPQHPDYGISLSALAGVLASQGRHAEAENLLRQTLALKEQTLGPRHPQLCPTLARLGFCLAAQGHPGEGEPLLRRALDIARETWGMHHPETAQILNLLARLQSALKKPEAITTARQAMDSLLGALGAEHPITQAALPGLRLILAGQE